MIRGKRNILVSGASGIVGYGILRSLRRVGENLNLIATTIYEDSVAAGFSDIFEKAPLTNDSGYTEWLIKVINKHSVDFLIPGIEADMFKWVEIKQEIQTTGASILLNNTNLISLCKDKWKFYENLNSFDSPYVIDSSLEKDFDLLVSKYGLPFLMKPRRGYGSKGIVIVESKKIFEEHSSDIGDILMVQPLIGDVDNEFTTSAFCDGKGSFYSYMTLKRKLSKDGFTEKAEVVELDDVEDVLNCLCKIYNPVGPTNFQFRLNKGVLKLLEINPRISSSTSIRSAFGYNESSMAIDYYLNKKNPIQPIIRKGKAVRYMEDMIFYS